MFGKEEETVDFKDVETVIGASVKVEGNISCAGDVVVDGSVAGTLRTTKNLSIGEQAKIRADIEANTIIISGEVRGNVRASGRVDLRATGKIYGNVTAQLLAVAPGAILHGKCQMLGKNDAAAAEETNEAIPGMTLGHEKKSTRKEKERALAS